MGSKNANKDGSIFSTEKTRNGKKYVYWYFQPPAIDGRKQKPLGSFSTQGEAVEAKKQYFTSLETDGEYFEPSKITLSEWLDTWLEMIEPTISHNTYAKYTGEVKRHIKPNLGDYKLSSIRKIYVQQFISKLSKTGCLSRTKGNGKKLSETGKPLSPKTIKNIHGTLSKALEDAVEAELIAKNPASGIKLPKIERTEIHPLNETESRDFLKYINGNKYEKVMYTVLFTGMRESEALGLLWEDVDFKRKTITVKQQLIRRKIGNGELYFLQTTKSNRSRQIKVSDQVIDVLRTVNNTQLANKEKAGEMWKGWNTLQERSNSFVFTDELGEHLKQFTMYKICKEAGRAIGRPDLRVHDLRHTYAVISLQIGDDVKTLQENLGHATASFTLDKYGHVSEKMREESANRMTEYIRNLQNVAG